MIKLSFCLISINYIKFETNIVNNITSNTVNRIVSLTATIKVTTFLRSIWLPCFGYPHLLTTKYSQEGIDSMALLHDPVGRVGSLWGALEQEDEHHQHHRSSPLRNKKKELHSSALGLCASPPRAVHRTAESVEREKRPTFVTEQHAGGWKLAFLPSVRALVSFRSLAPLYSVTCRLSCKCTSGFKMVGWEGGLGEVWFSHFLLRWKAARMKGGKREVGTSRIYLLNGASCSTKLERSSEKRHTAPGIRISIGRAFCLAFFSRPHWGHTVVSTPNGCCRGFCSARPMMMMVLENRRTAHSTYCQEEIE